MRSELCPVEVLCVALVDDYVGVVVGSAPLFDAYADRITIAELDTSQPLIDHVDVALYDWFAQPEADHDESRCWSRTLVPATSRSESSPVGSRADPFDGAAGGEEDEGRASGEGRAEDGESHAVAAAPRGVGVR